MFYFIFSLSLSIALSLYSHYLLYTLIWIYDFSSSPFLHSLQFCKTKLYNQVVIHNKQIQKYCLKPQSSSIHAAGITKMHLILLDTLCDSLWNEYIWYILIANLNVGNAIPYQLFYEFTNHARHCNFIQNQHITCSVNRNI